MQYCISRFSHYTLAVKNVPKYKTQYTHAGDFFAKAHFFSRARDPLCVICSRASLKKYQKLSDDISFHFCEIKNYHDLSAMLRGEIPLAYIAEELLLQEIQNKDSWKSLELQVGKNYESEKIIAKLIEL